MINTNKTLKEKLSSLSIASLSTGALSLIPVGSGLFLGLAAILCGVFDIYRSRDKGSYRRSRRINISGITLGAIGLIGTFTLIVYSIVVFVSKYGIDSWL